MSTSTRQTVSAIFLGALVLFTARPSKAMPTCSVTVSSPALTNTLTTGDSPCPAPGLSLPGSKTALFSASVTTEAVASADAGLLTGNSFASADFPVNFPFNLFGGIGSTSSSFLLDNLVVSGPLDSPDVMVLFGTPFVSVSFNYPIEGVVNASSSAVAAATEAAVRVLDNWVGVLGRAGGELGLLVVGADRENPIAGVAPCAVAGRDIGVFAGLGCGAINLLATGPATLVPLGLPFSHGLVLQTSAFTFTGADGTDSGVSSALSNFTVRGLFPILPPGFTLAGLPPPPAPPALPAPSTLLLLGIGVAGLDVLRQRSRK